MAMFLHSLDDHLTDGQVAVSPLTLLLRSHAWMIMNRAFRNLAEGLPAGGRTVRSFIDDYYSSIQNSKVIRSLDHYCNLFRKQMATWMIAPILLSMKMNGISDFTRDVEIAYGSFGIAWRLLDDIRDIGDDIQKGSHSAIYLCLPKRLKNLWKKNSGNRAVSLAATKSILAYVLEHGTVDMIKDRVCTELDMAASIVETYKMRGFARELRCLAHPLRNGSCTQRECYG
jgi:hypothetical protein